MIILECTPTNDNVADAMTKALTKTLFCQHYDTYMGLRKPDYCKTEKHTTHDDATSTILPTSILSTHPAECTKQLGGGDCTYG